jgi:hypothetical protein
MAARKCCQAKLREESSPFSGNMALNMAMLSRRTAILDGRERFMAGSTGAGKVSVLSLLTEREDLVLVLRATGIWGEVLLLSLSSPHTV